MNVVRLLSFRLASVSLAMLLVLALVSGASASEAGFDGLFAYVGPGAGLGMLGSLLAVLAAVVIGLLGLVLYPFMLLRKKLRKRDPAKVASTEE